MKMRPYKFWNDFIKDHTAEGLESYNKTDTWLGICLEMDMENHEWFPATGYEHAGTAELEVYPAGDTSAEDYRCQVWIPIVKK